MTHHPTGKTLVRARTLAQTQGWFYLVTGAWPLAHGASFQMVTGRKLDFWLAQTVGLLLCVLGFVLIAAARARRVTLEIIFLGGLSAAVLMGMDLYCVSRPRTTNAYLLDAVIEAALVLFWFRVWRCRRKENDGSLYQS